jgi:hypothetical protein
VAPAEPKPDDTNAQLQVALSRNSDSRQQLYSDLQGIGANVKNLREQAAACIGEPELFKQESGVEVHHPDLPDDPTVEPPHGDFTNVEPPGYASPFD